MSVVIIIVWVDRRVIIRDFLQISWLVALSERDVQRK